MQSRISVTCPGLRNGMGDQRNGGYGGDSSSGEEDGDAQWRAAIDSVTTTSVFLSSLTNGLPATSTTTASNSDDDSELNLGPQPPKQYQIKAQKMLENILETTLEVVEHSTAIPCDDSKTSEGGIRLFKNAPVGVVFDHIDELQRPTKKPKILPGKEINEKSKKFKQRIQSMAIEGKDIIAAGNRAREKSIARLEAKEAAAKAAAKGEEERVAELKKVRGEKWLPSIAREMKLQAQR
ncbi:uncharacterized protein LOC111794698 [Cucurbita pepo subsp. pepo]|uniref:uncharacterized protein LOC111794698 n=1 Tax=Cucurbita pepo subsp. pepo TaxID=3664 RepID=UPI000C9D5643|nr:uncharacterized protein LOC111794698 [Cucurbita pepo subsp. pepo]